MVTLTSELLPIATSTLKHVSCQTWLTDHAATLWKGKVQAQGYDLRSTITYPCILTLLVREIL